LDAERKRRKEGALATEKKNCVTKKGKKGGVTHQMLPGKRKMLHEISSRRGADFSGRGENQEGERSRGTSKKEGQASGGENGRHVWGKKRTSTWEKKEVLSVKERLRHQKKCYPQLKKGEEGDSRLHAGDRKGSLPEEKAKSARYCK